MTPEIFGLVLTIIGSVAGATWLLRSKLSDIETALKIHIIEFSDLKSRVIKLEPQRKARR